jgi:hypothetical protein
MTLEIVEAAFSEWRNKRSSRSESIPKNLWAMAISLYPAYKRSKICHQLGLSGSQFKKHLAADVAPFPERGFVVASRDDNKETSTPVCDVQLTLQGKERTLTVCVSAQALSHVLPQLGLLL